MLLGNRIYKTGKHGFVYDVLLATKKKSPSDLGWQSSVLPYDIRAHLPTWPVMQHPKSVQKQKTCFTLIFYICACVQICLHKNTCTTHHILHSSMNLYSKTDNLNKIVLLPESELYM